MYEEYLSKALSNVITARQALVSSKEFNSKDLKNCAAYHVQQSIELILKYLIYNVSEYRNEDEIKQIYTHDLDKLIKKYIVLYSIYVPENIKKNAKTYTLWEAESRYDLHFSVRVDSVLKAIKSVEDWLVELKPAYNKKIKLVRSRYEYK